MTTKNKEIVPVEKQKTGLPQKMRAAITAAKSTGEVKPVHDAAKALTGPQWHGRFPVSGAR